MATPLDSKPITADTAEHDALAALEALLQSGEALTVATTGSGKTAAALPTSVRTGMLQIVHALKQRQSVAVVAVQDEITTQQAADLLNVSRPYLISLLEQGTIPFRRTGGGHRRIRLVDVLVYKQQRDAARREALDELSRLDQELGLYDL